MKCQSPDKILGKILSKIFGAGLACLLYAPAFFPSVAFGWADMGHEIVGAVAEANVKVTTHDYLRGLLGIEPLEYSAIFPDHVRDDDRFGHHASATPSQSDDNNFDDYHFCEIPVGFTYATKPRKYDKDCHGAVTGAIATLKDPKVKRAEKVIAVRYLVHVMGDIGQPLHVGNGFDRGGNSCQIKFVFSPGDAPVATNLHSYWDETLVQYLGRSYADPTSGRRAAIYLNDYMANIRRRHPDLFTPEAKAKYAMPLDDQLAEAGVFREAGVYPDDPATIAGAPKGEEYKFRPYCQWYTDAGMSKPGAGSAVQKEKIPTLGLEYAQKFAPIAELQMVKAGLRLAAVLDEIADATSALPHAQLTDADQQAVLSDLQSRLKNH